MIKAKIERGWFIAVIAFLFTAFLFFLTSIIKAEAKGTNIALGAVYLCLAFYFNMIRKKASDEPRKSS